MLNVNHQAGWKEGLGVWLSGACLAFIGPVSVPSKKRGGTAADSCLESSAERRIIGYLGEVLKCPLQLSECGGTHHCYSPGLPLRNS